MLRPHYPEKFVFIIKISLVNGCAGCWHTSCHLIVQATELGWGISDNEVWSPADTDHGSQLPGCSYIAVTTADYKHLQPFPFIHSGCRDFRIARSQVFTIKFCWKLPFYWEINKQGDGRASGMGARRYLLLHATHTRAWNEPSRSMKLYNHGEGEEAKLRYCTNPARDW